MKVIGSERHGNRVQLQLILKDFIPESPKGSVEAVAEAVRQLSSLANLLQHLAFCGIALTPKPLLMNIQLLEQAQLARTATWKLTFDLPLLTSPFECFSMDTFGTNESHSSIHFFEYFVVFAATVLLPFCECCFFFFNGFCYFNWNFKTLMV